MDLGQISARGADRIIRMSWTLADLAGAAEPGLAEIGYALGPVAGSRRYERRGRAAGRYGRATGRCGGAE